MIPATIYDLEMIVEALEMKRDFIASKILENKSEGDPNETTLGIAELEEEFRDIGRLRNSFDNSIRCMKAKLYETPLYIKVRTREEESNLSRLSVLRQ